MAENDQIAGAPVGPAGGAATPPKVLPWLVIYVIGRFAIAAALVTVLWWAGLGSFPGLLFGLLLSMPVSYLLLRPSRDRLTEALAARAVARRAAKDDLRKRLSGEG
jgi:membrane protein implicated in regulation of membrane protease activity